MSARPETQILHTLAIMDALGALYARDPAKTSAGLVAVYIKPRVGD